MSDTSSFADAVKDFGCTTDTFIGVLTGVNAPIDTTISVDATRPIMITKTSTSYVEDYSLIKSKSFTCPCCGTHYIARDPGFVPNCHNCGSIMRCDDT